MGSRTKTNGSTTGKGGRGRPGGRRPMRPTSPARSTGDVQVVRAVGSDADAPARGPPVEGPNATTGGNASAIMRWASSGAAALRTARTVRISSARLLRQPIRYMTPSMSPQARLQPSAPMSIVRTSSRPAPATLNEPVMVSTMINPKSTSEMRSTGSRTRIEGRLGGSAAMGRVLCSIVPGVEANARTVGNTRGPGATGGSSIDRRPAGGRQARA